MNRLSADRLAVYRGLCFFFWFVRFWDVHSLRTWALARDACQISHRSIAPPLIGTAIARALWQCFVLCASSRVSRGPEAQKTAAHHHSRHAARWSLSLRVFLLRFQIFNHIYTCLSLQSVYLYIHPFAFTMYTSAWTSSRPEKFMFILTLRDPWPIYWRAINTARAFEWPRCQPPWRSLIARHTNELALEIMSKHSCALADIRG